jgi:hypothetical protein
LFTAVSVQLPLAVVTTVVPSEADVVSGAVVSLVAGVVVVSVGAVVVVVASVVVVVGTVGWVVVVVIWVKEMLSVIGSVMVGTGFESIVSQAESDINNVNATAVSADSLFLKKFISILILSIIYIFYFESMALPII